MQPTPTEDRTLQPAATAVVTALRREYETALDHLWDIWNIWNICRDLDCVVQIQFSPAVLLVGDI